MCASPLPLVMSNHTSLLRSMLQHVVGVNHENELLRGILTRLAVGQASSSSGSDEQQQQQLDWDRVAPLDAQLRGLRAGQWTEYGPAVRLPLSLKAAEQARLGIVTSAAASAKRCDALQTQLDAALATLQSAQASAARSSADLDAAHKRAAASDERALSARAQRATARVEAERSAASAQQSEAAALRVDVRSARAQVATARAELDAAQEARRVAVERAVRAEALLKSRARELRTLSAAKSAALAQMQQGRGALRTVEAELSAMAARLELVKQKKRDVTVQLRLAQKRAAGPPASPTAAEGVTAAAEARPSQSSQSSRRGGRSRPAPRAAAGVPSSLRRAANTEHEWRRECLELRRRCRVLERENAEWRDTAATSQSQPQPRRTRLRSSPQPATATPWTPPRRGGGGGGATAAAPAAATAATGALAAAAGGGAAKRDSAKAARVDAAIASSLRRLAEASRLAVELNRVSDCLYHAKIRMAKGAGRVRGKGVELHLKLDLDAAGALVVHTLDGVVAIETFLTAAALCES